MVDTKISALTAASAAATTNELAINEAGTSKKVTAAQLKTLITTAPVFGSGSASANTAPKLTSGDLNTTAEAGAFEYLTNTPYFTPSAANRAVQLVGHITTVDSDVTGANVTTVQSIFPVAQDRLTVIAATTYVFELLFGVSMGTTTTTMALAFDAGTATYTSIRYAAMGLVSAAINVVGAMQSTVMVDTAAATVCTITGAGSTKWLLAKGVMRINAGGTMVPQFKFSADPTGTILVKKDSYMILTPIGSNTVASVGNWS